MRFFSEIIMAISITYVQSIWLALASLSSHSPSSSLALSGVSLAPSGALRGRSREEGGGRVHSSDPGRASLGPRSLCLLSSRSPVAAAGVGVRTLLFITRMHTHAHVQEPLSLHSTCPQAASRAAEVFGPHFLSAAFVLFCATQTGWSRRQPRMRRKTQARAVPSRSRTAQRATRPMRRSRLPHSPRRPLTAASGHACLLRPGARWTPGRAPSPRRPSRRTSGSSSHATPVRVPPPARPRPHAGRAAAAESAPIGRGKKAKARLRPTTSRPLLSHAFRWRAPSARFGREGTTTLLLLPSRIAALQVAPRHRHRPPATPPPPLPPPAPHAASCHPHTPYRPHTPSHPRSRWPLPHDHTAAPWRDQRPRQDRAQRCGRRRTRRGRRRQDEGAEHACR